MPRIDPPPGCGDPYPHIHAACVDAVALLAGRNAGDRGQVTIGVWRMRAQLDLALLALNPDGSDSAPSATQPPQGGEPVAQGTPDRQTPAEAPPLTDLVGMAPTITGDLPPAEHVRRQWAGEPL